MNKDLIKYALIALGVYLVYEYIQKNGGLAAVLGTGTGGPICPTPLTAPQLAAAAAVGTVAIDPKTGCPVLTTAQQAAVTALTSSGGGGSTAKPPLIDMTGLAVVADVNNSLTGIVKINGQPTRLSIIQTNGQIYDATGTEISAALTAEGVDVAALRTAFASAPGSQAGTQSGTLPCQQPNIFKSGICVDPFTLQPIPNTMSQSEQNAGMSGLGYTRYTPAWLM